MLDAAVAKVAANDYLVTVPKSMKGESVPTRPPTIRMSVRATLDPIVVAKATTSICEAVKAAVKAQK